MPDRSWKFHAGRLLSGIALAVLLGVLSGHPVLVVGLAAVVYAAWHLANLWRLYRWLAEPAGDVPESFGIWRDIYNSFDTLQSKLEEVIERARIAGRS